jgi:hypothetical protein
MSDKAFLNGVSVNPAPLYPRGSLAPDLVMLSRSIIAYYDPIRQSRRFAAISLSLIPNTFAVRERETFTRQVTAASNGHN